MTPTQPNSAGEGHTPGPWHFRAGSGAFGSFTVLADEPDTVNRVIADVADKGEQGRSEAEANARLISAAPELLEALETLVGDGCEGASFSERMKKAQAALAKARGGQS